MRDALVSATEARAEAAEAAFSAVLSNQLARMQGVTLSRMGGPKARKDTRWWKADEPFEVKAVDPTYVVPDKLADEVEEALRPVALRVAMDVAADTARRLGVDPEPTGDNMFALDQDVISRAVEDAVSEILGVTQRQARDVRAAILEADKDADDLDEVLDRIEAAYRRGGNWVLMSGRTLANALVNEAALLQAQALGVTHAQWLSKRDVRVRPTHRVADGQVRAIGDQKFRVGLFDLRFPGDPTDLPGSWEEIANCRCGLLFAQPSESHQRAVRQLGEATTPGELPEAAARLLAEGAAGRPIVVGEPVVGFRALPESPEPTPGQWVTFTDDLPLSLVAPSAWSAAAPMLAVLIGAGATVTVAGGAVTLAAGTPLEVVAASAAGVQARVVESGAP